MNKDYIDRIEFKGLYVTKSGLIFDKYGKFKKPSFRYNKKGDVVVRRLRFYDNGKQVEYGYDRFVYAAWNQDTFDISNRDMIVYRATINNSSHVDDLAVCTRGEMLERIHDNKRFISIEYHNEIRETWEQVKDVYTEREMADHLGIPLSAFKLIIEKGD